MTSTADKFEVFHHNNPIVYDTLVSLIREWIDEHGMVKLGIRMLWETARWRIIKATNNADYKMNDHYTSYYIRLILSRHDEWVPLFELRSSPSDAWILAKI